MDSSTVRCLVPSEQTIFHGLKQIGDGKSSGKVMKVDEKMETAVFVSEDTTLDVCLNYTEEKPKGPSFFSRMLCVKQLFHASINRMEEYGCAHSVGLVLFGTDVKEACPLTAYLLSRRVWIRR